MKSVSPSSLFTINSSDTNNHEHTKTSLSKRFISSSSRETNALVSTSRNFFTVKTKNKNDENHDKDEKGDLVAHGLKNHKDQFITSHQSRYWKNHLIFLLSGGEVNNEKDDVDKQFQNMHEMSTSSSNGLSWYCHRRKLWVTLMSIITIWFFGEVIWNILVDLPLPGTTAFEETAGGREETAELSSSSLRGGGLAGHSRTTDVYVPGPISELMVNHGGIPQPPPSPKKPNVVEKKRTTSNGRAAVDGIPKVNAMISRNDNQLTQA